jgi:hypothetical protein
MLIILAVLGLLAFVVVKSVSNSKYTGIEQITGFGTIGKTDQQRVKFIEQYGWDVSDNPVEYMEVLIPAKFDDTYTQYNNIQKMQGADLSKYNGKKVKRYTYEVKNYPGQAQGIRANLLVYDDKIIGGDICSIEFGGFIHGIKSQNDK